MAAPENTRVRYRNQRARDCQLDDFFLFLFLVAKYIFSSGAFDDKRGSQETKRLAIASTALADLTSPKLAITSTYTLL